MASPSTADQRAVWARNAQDRSQHRLEKDLGHVWKLTIQESLGNHPTIPHTLRVWASCTCGRWAGDACGNQYDALAGWAVHAGVDPETAAKSL